MKLLKLLLPILLVYTANGQPAVKYSSTDIQIALNRLNVLGSMLYIAAHPDDENQGILSYMTRGRLYQAAYLSLTRGGGGQNLLGPEKGILLGVLRTQELLAARNIDGAKQFFTRAIDFGYSKSPDESLLKWDRQLLLGDVVHVIREIKPDVIVTRFSEQWGGHGHHIASAILAKQAFTAAADPKQFPRQLEKLEPWQAKRIFWNTWRPQEERPADAPPFLSLNLGEYKPLLGLSFREIAAKSRSMHKTQGFGSTPRRGTSFDFFEHTAGDIVYKDIFDDVETSWKRVPNSENIQQKVDELLAAFNPENPQKCIPGLIELYKLLEKKEKSYWIETKKKEVKKLLQMCSGLWLESVALNESVTPGDTIQVRTSILNRSDYNVTLEKTKVTYSSDSLFNESLNNGIIKSTTSTILIPQNTNFTQPYWLQKAHGETMFNVDENFSGAAIEQPEMRTIVNIKYDDLSLKYELPVLYKWNDPRNGEQYKPFTIQPDVSISLSQNSYIFADKQAKDVAVTIIANSNNVSGEIKIDIPQGWTIKPAKHAFSLEKINEQASVEFKVSPQKSALDGEILPYAIIENKRFDQQLIKVGYDHIPEQNILVQAKAKLIKLNIIVPQKKIAYIMGSGDEIPQSLQQIGMQVDLLSDDDLSSIDYNLYDAVICGVRAFNTRENLGFHQKRILEYVEKGGTWIVQHNTRFGSQVGQIGPYTYTARGRSRISEEDAKIEILQPEHSILNWPNKINQQDFDGWVQERGTYMAEEWDENFVPLLAGNDKGETPQKGGLLYSKFGKGTFIFTGLSFFRQLPAGVPGAYRIFVNLICAGDKK